MRWGTGRRDAGSRYGESGGRRPARRRRRRRRRRRGEEEGRWSSCRWPHGPEALSANRISVPVTPRHTTRSSSNSSNTSPLLLFSRLQQLPGLGSPSNHFSGSLYGACAWGLLLPGLETGFGLDSVLCRARRVVWAVANDASPGFI